MKAKPAIVKLADINIGQKLWSIRRQKYGIVTRVGKTGWVTLKIEGKLTRNWYEYLRKRKPKKDLGYKLLEDLTKARQDEVLQSSYHTGIPVHQVMVLKGYSKK